MTAQVTSRARVLPPALVAVALWSAMVVGVQPWERVDEGPQASLSGVTSAGKGVLVLVLFLLGVLLAAPRFRVRVPVAVLVYLLYVGVAASSALLIADPGPAITRAVRLALGLLVPVLLWRWLAGAPERFLWAHRTAHVLLAVSVLAGALLAPGLAWHDGASFLGGGRLGGVALPMLPPRVGEVGAVVAGLTAVGLVFRRVRLLPGTALLGLGLALIVLSRTRTAAAACLASLVVALLVVSSDRRARLLLVGLATTAALAGALAFTALSSWVLRGQSADQVSSLTGRAHAWDFVLSQPVALQTALLGHGLGNKRVLLRRGEGDIDYMSIDNSWLSLYWETGLVGVVLVVLVIVIVLVSVLRAPTAYVRAAGSFLLCYVVIASFPESGLSDLSSLTLHVLVAACASSADRALHRPSSTAEARRPAWGAAPPLPRQRLSAAGTAR